MKKTVLVIFGQISAWLPTGFKTAIIRTPLISGLFRGVLNASVNDRLSEVIVTAGTLRGWKVLLNMKAEKSRWLGTYEPSLDAAIKKYVRAGMTVYDVGANIGYVSLWFAKAVGAQGKVFSFEPLPENAERIRRNAALNGVGNLEVVQAAVIDRNRIVSFLQHDSVGMGKAEGSAGRDDQDYVRSIQVQGISLDEFMAQGGPLPDVIKIDIEGGEVMALPGMRGLLAKAHPVLMLELHGGDSEKVAWDVLTELGYSLRPMHEDQQEIGSLTEMGWKAYVLALPKG